MNLIDAKKRRKHHIPVLSLCKILCVFCTLSIRLCQNCALYEDKVKKVHASLKGTVNVHVFSTVFL